MHPFSHSDYFSLLSPAIFPCLTALYVATRGYEQALFVHYPRQTVSLAVVFPLPAAIFFFFAQEENEEVRRQIARLKKRTGMRVADGPRASRPNFHCILETAGYYEHEMFLLFPSSFPRSVSSFHVFALFPACPCSFLCMFPDRY